MQVYSIIFSPTGGTKKAADLVARGIAKTYEEIDLTDAAKDFGDCAFKEGDVCIVSVPSFGGRVPKEAASRMAKLHGNKAKAILLTTYGNREFEDTLVEMQDLMEAAGFCPVAAIAAVTEHSIVRSFAKGRPDESDEKELTAFAEKIKAVLGEERSSLELPGNRPYKQVGVFPSKPQLTESCVKCGICVKACPVQAIPEDLSISMDEEKCISCMRCEAICPIGARKVAQPVIDFLTEKLSAAAQGHKENQLFL